MKPMTTMKRRNTAITIAVSLAIGGAGTLLVERVRAAGAPTGAITYTGFLENPDGTPVESPVAITLRLFDEAAAGTELCEVSDPDVLPIAGRFQIPLPTACENAMKANPNLWMEVSVGGVAVGRTQVGAVPYALEAGHSLSADSAPWAGITGVPAGIADGDQNTTYTAGSGLDLTTTTFSVDPTDFNSVPQHVLALPSVLIVQNAWTELTSTTIQAPVAGRIVALASGGLWCPGGASCDDVNDTPYIKLTLTVNGSQPSLNSGQYGHLNGGSITSRYNSVTLHQVFQVAAGSHTLRLMAHTDGVNLNVDGREITAFFIPD